MSPPEGLEEWRRRWRQGFLPSFVVVEGAMTLSERFVTLNKVRSYHAVRMSRASRGTQRPTLHHNNEWTLFSNASPDWPLQNDTRTRRTPHTTPRRTRSKGADALRRKPKPTQVPDARQASHRVAHPTRPWRADNAITTSAH